MTGIQRPAAVRGVDRDGLQAWLSQTHPELAGDAVAVSLIEGGRSNLTYSVDGPSTSLILRRPPLGHVLSHAHDMRREYRVMAALASSVVPVPTLVDLVDDTEAAQVTGTVFMVMERSPGQVLIRASQNAGYTAAGLRRLSFELVDHLAELHAVDPAAVGLADFGRPDGYLARQLVTWRRQLDSSRSRDVPELDELQETLATGMPESSRSGVVHGDYRLDNVLVVGTPDEPHISAVLDWEMATLGDPLVDLGIFDFYWDIADLPGAFAGAVPSAVSAAAGYPTPDELVEHYEHRSGSRVPNLQWYRSFAAYKLAVILEGIHFRYRAGDTLGDGFGQIGALVAPIARRGLEKR